MTQQVGVPGGGVNFAPEVVAGALGKLTAQEAELADTLIANMGRNDIAQLLENAGLEKGRVIRTEGEEYDEFNEERARGDLGITYQEKGDDPELSYPQQYVDIDYEGTYDK